MFKKIYFATAILVLFITACSSPNSPVATPAPTSEVETYDFTDAVNSISANQAVELCAPLAPNIDFRNRIVGETQLSTTSDPSSAIAARMVYPIIAVDEYTKIDLHNYPDFYVYTRPAINADFSETINPRIKNMALAKTLLITDGAVGYGATWQINMNENGSFTVDPIKCFEMY